MNAMSIRLLVIVSALFTASVLAFGGPSGHRIASIRRASYTGRHGTAVRSATLAVPTPTPSSPPATQSPKETPIPAALPTNTPAPVVILDQTLRRLTDPLDEPEFYCVDVAESGNNVRLLDPLQAHTCKPLSQTEDELFRFNHPGQGQIFMPEYDLCVEAAEAGADHSLLLRTCSDAPLQRFTYTPQGQIALAGGTGQDLCIAAAPGSGIPTGGPSHVRRDLALQPCAEVDPGLSRWTIDAN